MSKTPALLTDNQVCMDSMEPVSSLDGTYGEWYTYRFRDAVHLHALLQLPD
jgi:hypothetical protein